MDEMNGIAAFLQAGLPPSTPHVSDPVMMAAPAHGAQRPGVGRCNYQKEIGQPLGRIRYFIPSPYNSYNSLFHCPLLLRPLPFLYLAFCVSMCVGVCVSVCHSLSLPVCCKLIPCGTPRRACNDHRA